MDLPREINIEAIDPNRSFEVNSQRARRLASAARAIQKISLPIVCNADTAKQIAEARLFTAWAERDLIKLSVSRTWLALDPSDVVDLGNGTLLRIASVTQSGGLLKIEGFSSYAETLTSSAAADGGQNLLSDALAPVSSVLYLMDIPLLQTGWTISPVFMPQRLSCRDGRAHRSSVPATARLTAASGCSPRLPLPVTPRQRLPMDRPFIWTWRTA